MVVGKQVKPQVAGIVAPLLIPDLGRDTPIGVLRGAAGAISARHDQSRSDSVTQPVTGGAVRERLLNARPRQEALKRGQVGNSEGTTKGADVGDAHGPKLDSRKAEAHASSQPDVQAIELAALHG